MMIKNLKFLIFIFFLIFFLSISTISKGSTILPAAETSFAYQSIALTDFGLNTIKGYPTYLDIGWKAYFLTGETQAIGANCYFNCLNAEIPDAPFGPCQNCSSVAYTNTTGTCTIKTPAYLTRIENNITCLFYNTLDSNKVAYVEIQNITNESHGLSSVPTVIATNYIPVMDTSETIYEQNTTSGQLALLVRNIDYTVLPNTIGKFNITAAKINLGSDTVVLISYGIIRVPSVIFWPIKFDVQISGNFNATVGNTFELPIQIKNSGIIVDSYTVNVTPKGPSWYLASVERFNKTDNVSYGKIATSLPKVTFRSTVTDRITFDIMVKSNTEPIVNLNTSCIVGPEDTNYVYFGNCSSIGATCLDGRCWKESSVDIAAGAASLPEFDWFGVVQIILLSAIFLIIFAKKLR